ncbi:MAG: hypothetical protein RM368_20085 [Nostoc sp. DedSLP03]|jgi:hypothetical protein|uniref:hypothetical protein n=1 Tax=Nostoc sp. DedSLP03 TaxID=3075400 RepID=UPI002AD29493|nr:hypothetical protein [Nostoc sp. DedSLP03]MDZ7967242.1 hypothetical protein [Nostoc sp. DedSLP03]
MESTLFTALTTNEEANLSGGFFFNVPNKNVVITNQYASAKAYGFKATAIASNYNSVYIDN